MTYSGGRRRLACRRHMLRQRLADIHPRRPENLKIPGIEVGVPVEINIDNAVAAAAASIMAGRSRRREKRVRALSGVQKAL